MKNIIVGICIKQDDKVLMVQEAEERIRGLWNFPAGHLDEKEDIFEGAIRETKEETGYDVEITGILSIINYINGDKNILRIAFNGKIVGGNVSFDENEILDVKWIPISDIKNMTDKELRGYLLNEKLICDIEQGINYPKEVIRNMIIDLNNTEVIL